MKCNKREVQSPVPVEEHQAPVWAGGQITGKQLRQVGPEGPGRQTDREPAVCPHSKEGSQQLDLSRRSKAVLFTSVQ